MDDKAYEISEIARITQEIIEALQPIAETVCAAIQAFIERVREMFIRIAKIAKLHLANIEKRIQIASVYSRLRSWRIPHLLSVIVAYLWVVKRWPPHTVMAG